MRWQRFLNPTFAPEDDAGSERVADTDAAERPDSQSATQDAEAMLGDAPDEPWMENLDQIGDDNDFYSDMRKLYGLDRESSSDAEAETEVADEADQVEAEEVEAEEEAGSTEEIEQPEAEAEEQTETEETPENAPAPELAIMREIMPDAVIETEDDARAHLSRLRESDEVLRAFEQLADGDDHLLKYIALRKDGVDKRLAIAEAFGEMAQAPDPDDDPEAYARWVARQEVKKEREKLLGEQQEKTQSALRNRAQEAQRIFNATVQREKWDEERATIVANVYQQLTTGDPHTGRFRADTFEVIDRGIRYPQLVSAISDVVQLAEKQGPSALKEAEDDSPAIASIKAAIRNAFVKGAKKVKETEKTIRHAPNFDGQGSRSRELTPAEQERRRYENAFESQGSIDMSWPPRQ